MGKPTGFLEKTRELPATKAPEDRIKDYKEFYLKFPEENLSNKQLVVWIVVCLFVTADVH